MIRFATILLAASSLFCASAIAGHSRHSYVDGGQSADGRFTVIPKIILGEKPKKGPQPYHWEYTWRDNKTGKQIQGRLEDLRSGSSNVFDPVGSHILVAPNGETFALWTPQVMVQAPEKKPQGSTGDEIYRNFEGFRKRLVIYRKDGQVIKEFGIKDFLSDEDWNWFFYHQRQTYWLVDYPGLHTRSAPRPFYALYRVSPDYTVLEFQVGANPEATHKAKQRGVTPPEPRTVWVRLTDGTILKTPPSDNLPVQPFTGPLANKEQKQRDYVPSLDPLRKTGRFTAPD